MSQLVKALAAKSDNLSSIPKANLPQVLISTSMLSYVHAHTLSLTHTHMHAHTGTPTMLITEFFWHTLKSLQDNFPSQGGSMLTKYKIIVGIQEKQKSSNTLKKNKTQCNI